MAQKSQKKPPVKRVKALKSASNLKEAIVLAALALAEERSWSQVSLSDIAKKAKISLSVLREECADKTDILMLLGRYLDRKVLDAVSEPTENPRDQLFEVMMARFDILQDHRAGIVSMLESLITDPKQAIISLPHLCRSMGWMLEAAGVDANGAKGAAKILGLSIVYLKVLKDWMDDESEDLSKTMASLDQMLSRADQIADRLGL